MKQGSSGSTYKFQPRQIVYLEHETTRLYAEVIEVVAAREICWVRPLMMAVSSLSHNGLPGDSLEQLVLYDLREGADLLWPASLFQPALDTEVIPFLVRLGNPDEVQQTNNLDAHKQLSSFVQKVWHVYKSSF
ncbi:MAG TPA: hypothetical protein V6C91_02505 [Coleofasciculaceae cyanobacterium]